MNKQDLINKYVEQFKVTGAEAKRQVEFYSNVLATALTSGDEVTLPGLGKLKLRSRNARTGRNPKTGEAINIPSKHVVKFSISSDLNTKLNAATDAPAA